MVAFQCPDCGGKMSAREELAGKRVRCPHCGHAVHLPRTTSSTFPTVQVPIQPETPRPNQGPKAPISRTKESRFDAVADKPPHRPSPESITLTDQLLFPGYEILGTLGSGGMGVVYRARQTNLDRQVALKTILVGQQTKPVTVARFEKEAMTIARLRHPNIVMAYDFGRQGDHWFLAMELLEGETLEGYIERHGPLPEAVAWGLARQTAAGLAHAAQLGVVHRDIKPSNLILTEPPAGSLLPAGLPLVKITDFGLSLLRENLDSSTARLTLLGVTLGTPVYMAPEQFAGSDVDCRADVYSLGATLLHMLTGRVPFTGTNFCEIMVDKARGEPHIKELAGKVSTESIRLIGAMLARDPGRRPGNYQELLQQIDALPVVHSKVLSSTGARAARLLSTSTEEASQDAAEVPTVPETLVQSGRRKRRRLWSLVALALLTAVGWRAALFWMAHTTLPVPPPLSRVEGGQPLFDGATLSGWQLSEGGWNPTQDEEGGKVLSGRGIIRRLLPPQSSYRLNLGMDLGKAAAVELHFGLHASDSGETLRYVMRVSREGVQLGQRSGDRGPWQALSPVRPFPPRDDGAMESPYKEMRVERHASGWWAFFQGQVVGSVAVARDQELSEMRLVTEGGPAFFEAVEIAKLVDVEP